MSELDELAADLGRISRGAEAAAKRVTMNSSRNVQRMARDFSRGIKHAPRYPRSISYDVTATPQGWQGEIGPDDTAENQGFLGYVYEMGNATTPPNAHLGPALDREGPEFEAAIAQTMIDDLMGRL